MKNEFPVSIYGKIEKFSDTISRARVRIFYKGLNRNATYITEEIAEKNLKEPNQKKKSVSGIS